MGRPIGSAAVTYSIPADAKRRLRALAAKARGILRAVIKDRILADEPATLREIAERYDRPKSAAYRAEIEALREARVPGFLRAAA